MFHSFHHSTIRAVEIIGSEDCHDIHVCQLLTVRLFEMHYLRFQIVMLFKT